MLGWDAGRHASSKGSHDLSIIVPYGEADPLLAGRIFFISCKAGKQSVGPEARKMQRMSKFHSGRWGLITGSKRVITSCWVYQDGSPEYATATALMAQLCAISEKLARDAREARLKARVGTAS